ncbi:MAG: pyrrolysine--tRNA(Pyl) ligase large subunit [Deltaproteobacteria bacterium]|nr:pyrrolysine--tRNA(Pyl) ligase large subunit [Deltaproteobacteria bacterium]MBW2507663.1 pyrrolysine--tRNA(Pyl) ligase large subunit [Deltaproteobacteria bacterium]
MKISWTDTQLTRLKELAACGEDLGREFGSEKDRDAAFQLLEKKLVRSRRRELDELRSGPRRPRLCRLESRLVEALNDSGFVQVTTPTILSKALLARMSIDENHPLTSQIFWLGKDRCLRPMLAPHLYFVLKDLLRLWEKPVRIFEVGSCFRKESQGAQHANEFTMLNLVEMGLEEGVRQQRLEELAVLVTEAAGVSEFALQPVESTVYGETVDILAGENRLEIGSSAMGPHALDRAWQITDAWVGIGFGLERLLMVAEGIESLGKLGRSLGYLDGIRLNI